MYIEEVEGFKKLNPKHKEFLTNYLETLNATKAYKKTYPKVKTENTAAVNGYKLLRNAKIERVLNEYYSNLWKSKDDLIGKTFKQLQKMIEFDIADYLDEHGNIELEKVKELDSYAIQEVRKDITAGKLGNNEKVSIKTHDKLKAITEMTKLLGMVRENIDITSGGEPLPVTININPVKKS